MISEKSNEEFDGSDLMIFKTSRSEIVGILKSAELPAFDDNECFRIGPVCDKR